MGLIPVERSRKGSGASGNKRRAAASSPPWRSGSSASRMSVMPVTLALLAMLIELCIGYPKPVLRAIGHPVTWMGALIDWLDRFLNRDAPTPVLRATGIVAVAVVLCITATIAFVIGHQLLRLPFGIFALGIVASSMIAQRS